MIKKTLLILFTALVSVTVVNAQGYQPLVGIPGLDDVNSDFGTYVNTLYALSISIAALLAVIRIVVAGIKYMLSDVVTSKAEAKKDIQNSLIGLLVVLMAVLVLTVINPNITNVDLSLTQLQTPDEEAAPPPSDYEILAQMDADHNWGIYSYFDADNHDQVWLSDGALLGTFVNQCTAAGRVWDYNPIAGEGVCFAKEFVDPANGESASRYQCGGFTDCTPLKLQTMKDDCIKEGGTVTPDPVFPNEFVICKYTN